MSLVSIKFCWDLLFGVLVDWISRISPTEMIRLPESSPRSWTFRR